MRPNSSVSNFSLVSSPLLPRTGRSLSLILLCGLQAAAILLSPRQGFAKTWSVDEGGSIQDAINSAVAGDTVLVSPGTYSDPIDFLGKSLTVLGKDGPQQTILDGTTIVGQPIVSFKNGETQSAVLGGFTLQNAEVAIWVTYAQPSIIGNIIRNNKRGGLGFSSGVGQYDVMRPIIENNIVCGNNSDSIGGGIYVWGSFSPIIDNNLICGNTARYDGAGLLCLLLHGGAVITRNVIRGNSSGDHGGGIYFAFWSSSSGRNVEIAFNIIDQNSAGGIENTGNSGGGIWLFSTDAWVHHNTIVGNTGDGPSAAYGGGIVIEQPGSPTIEQNIIAFNAKGGGIWCGFGATPVIRNNLAWQNVGGDGVMDCPNWWQSDGNVVDNPYFCDLSNQDYTVASNSGVITHPAGPLGAFPTPGCGPVSILPSTWGSLKSRYH